MATNAAFSSSSLSCIFTYHTGRAGNPVQPTHLDVAATGGARERCEFEGTLDFAFAGELPCVGCLPRPVANDSSEAKGVWICGVYGGGYVIPGDGDLGAAHLHVGRAARFLDHARLENCRCVNFNKKKEMCAMNTILHF